MMDICKYKDIHILRREPSKIYSFTIIIAITLVLIIIFCFCFKYTKYKYYIANVTENDDGLYLYTTVTKEYFNEISQNRLIIDNREYDFELIEFEKNVYDNNYSIILKIASDKNLQKNGYVIFSLKKENTTLFKEISERIKED
ncbi:MAG: hypothetical protein HFI86_02835 [Bacilli bacterium]|nr:hypothetical protein [Bacilli bacterium]